MVQHSETLDKNLIAQIVDSSKQIAGSGRIKAACVFGDYALQPPRLKVPAEILLVIHDFQPKLMNYAKVIDGRNIIIIAADEWVFERDVDRGFLGEALAWGLIFPYQTLVGSEYWHLQEVKLKRRLILELLENLVLDFPELSYELHIRPEFFFYESVQSRIRLSPPMIYSMWASMREGSKKTNVDRSLQGFLRALAELDKEGAVTYSNGYARMSEKFVKSVQSHKTRLVNVSKAVPRAFFTSLLRILPRILNILSQNKEILLNLQKIAQENSRIANQIEDPREHVYVPTASGLVSLANRTDIEDFARKTLSTKKNVKVEVEPLGGILNDVYLVRAHAEGEERTIVVKRFKDWSSFKWFPLQLWSVGTRTFAVLGRSRLERECAINRLLHSKGFAVPKLLHVSPEKRLVFMEYVKGENATEVIRRLADSKTDASARKELGVIKRIGMKMGKVHALGIALGDTKPENFLIARDGRVFLMDFEQASRKGDRAWDIAEFLYYAGHDVPPTAGTHTAALAAEAFVTGYLTAGGDSEVVKRASNPKYTKVFSIFTLPHVMITITSICRKAEELKQEGD